MFRQILIPSSTDINISIPVSFVGKEIEITAHRIAHNKKLKRRKMATKWEDIVKFYRSINVDTKDYKFDREEANER